MSALTSRARYAPSQHGRRRAAFWLTPSQLTLWLTLWIGFGGGAGCAGGVSTSRVDHPLAHPLLTPSLIEHLSRCAPSAPLYQGSPSPNAPLTEEDTFGRGEEARERLERLALSDPHAALLNAPLLTAWRPLVRAALSAHPHLPQELSALTWVEGAQASPALWASLWLSVDLIGGLGAPLQGLIEPLLRADVSSERALLWLKAAPSWAPLSDLSVDPLKALSAWRKARWAPLKRGSVGVILEEQRLLYVNDSGEGVRLVQEVLRVNNKRGVEELGEVALPQRATLLELYSIKPDGARRAPVIIAEKESYSLQDLQVGDVLIARYLEPLSALRREGGALTPRLPLRDPQRAAWRRAYHVWRSGSTQPLTVDIHNTPLTPPPSLDPSLTVALDGAREVSLSRADWQGGSLVSVEVHEALPAPPEPASLSGGLPSVEVGDPTDEARAWGEVVSALRERLTLNTGELEALRRWALSPQRLGVRLWEAVRDDRPLLESPPPLETLREGRGARALVLWAALSSLGERCWLSLARPPQRRSTWRWSSTPPQAPQTSQISHPPPPLNPTEGYDHLLVRCEGRAHTQDTNTANPQASALFDPGLYLSPRDVRATYLDGGALLDVWPPPPELSCEELSGETPRAWPLHAQPLTPTAREGRPQERHDVSVALWLDPEGARGLLGARVLYAHVEHSLEGEEGALLFERLERASLEEQRAWLESQWGAWLGASEASEVRFVWSEQGGLALSYQLKVTARLPLKLSLSPQSWGARFASLKARHTPLLLPSITQTLTLNLNKPVEGAPQEPSTPSTPLLTLTGEEASLSWSAQEHASPSPEASFSLKVSAHKLTERWRLLGGALDPQGYNAWARFAREVSRREGSITLRLQEPPLKATPSALGAARK